ncbi:MAG: flagellar hook-associated protein FlgK [Pseudomonadota bacterium]
MTSALINIGASGAAAARAGIDLTAQNIANAENPNYARRSLGQSEFVASATIGLNSADAFGGVRLGAVQRAQNELLQLQARNSNSDVARADAELRGLRGTETALEQSQLYETLVDYEAALTRLESDPLDPTLRTLALETAGQLTDTIGLANRTLGSARELVQSEVAIGVELANSTASELAAINADLAAAQEGTARRASLLDARDAALRELSDEFGITATFNDEGLADVTINGSPGVVLVQGSVANTLTATTAADGTVALSVGGQAIVPESGAMAGRQAALTAQANAQIDLDAIAASVIATGNSAQASGSASDGSAGQPLFSGTNASDIAVALTDGSQLATAPSGAAAGSRDTTVLGNLLTSIASATGPVAGADSLLSGLSSRISGLDTRREGLAIIAESAQTQLLSETGVDLDEEAADLVRLQQAFEANARVIQVATELFDTILGLR